MKKGRVAILIFGVCLLLLSCNNSSSTVPSGNILKGEKSTDVVRKPAQRKPNIDSFWSGFSNAIMSEMPEVVEQYINFPLLGVSGAIGSTVKAEEVTKENFGKAYGNLFHDKLKSCITSGDFIVRKFNADKDGYAQFFEVYFYYLPYNQQNAKNVWSVKWKFTQFGDSFKMISYELAG